MNQQPLIDIIPFIITPQQLHESMEKNGGKVIVEGILQRADVKNQNSRIYPKHILEKEVEKYIKGPIAERRALGELDHPDTSIINLQNVSHNIMKVWWNGDDVMGKLEILGTPAGNIVKELIKSGIRLGISSRGLGSVKESIDDESVEVQEDFQLIGWDFVSEPSTQQAWMNPVNENMILENKKITHKYDTINKIITDILCESDGVCKCSLKSVSKK